jgi:hypothetical protein
VGVSEALKKVAHEAMAIRPNFAYTLSEVESDLRRVFATGWFSSCAPDAEDTRDGVKLIIKVCVRVQRRTKAHHVYHTIQGVSYISGSTRAQL